MKHRFSAVNLYMLGAICAAVFLQLVNCLNPPRFQVTAVPQSFRHSPDNLVVLISMNCIPNITDLVNFQSRWLAKKPDGSDIMLNPSSDSRISIRQGLIVDANLPAGTNVIIRNLSYLDNGTYRCEIQETDTLSNQVSEGASATVQLILEVRLKSVDINSTVRTFNDSQLVELGCDMSGYIRPQEDLFWKVNGVRFDPATSDGSKYSVSYRNGTDNMAQFGGSTTIPSLVTVLTIKDVSLADSGVYSCAIENTNLMNDVTLEVKPASKPSGYPQNVEVTVNSPTSFKVSWTEVPEAERNGNITHYEIVYTPVNSPILEQQPKISMTSGSVLDSILGGLEEFTMYSVSVRAVTIVGSGPPSPPQMNQTPEDVPSAPPRNLVILPLDKNSLQVSWERPEPNDVNGVLRLYSVKYCLPVRGLDNTVITNCTQFNVTGTENSVFLTSLKESTTYTVSVAAFTVGFGPAATRSARTGDARLPLEPPEEDDPDEATIVGIVIGVVLGVIAVVLVASVIIGFIIRNKLSRRQHKQIPSIAVESQITPVAETIRAPSPNLVPVVVSIGAGSLDREIVGEELTEPISCNGSLKRPTDVTEKEEGEEIEEHLEVSTQPKLELAELLKDEPPQYNLFDPTPPSKIAATAKESAQKEKESETVTVIVELNFDDDGTAADSAEKDDTDTPLSTAGGEQRTDTKQDLMELLQNDNQDSS